MKKYILTMLAACCMTAISAQSYQVVVTTTDGEKKVFATDQVTEINFNDTPNYKEANYYLSGQYTPLSSKDYALYTISFATGAPNAQGDPENVGDFQITLAINAPLSAESHKAAIPDGYYTAGTGNKTYDVGKTAMWIRTGQGTNDIETYFFIGGGVDVRYDGENCDLRASLISTNGETINISYYGKMTFSVSDSGSSEFEDDQTIEFTIGTGRCWANWFYPFCDDAALYLYTGSFNEYGKHLEGYELNVDLYMPKDDSHTSSWQPRITDGTYTMDLRERVYNRSYLPYTMRYGTELDLFGTPVLSGTYLRYIAADGRLQTAKINGGTMTVSNNGSKFVFDMVAENGIKIKATYDNTPDIMNVIDNSQAPEYPQLEADRQLSFIDEAAAFEYNMGDYIIQGLNSFIIMFSDPNQQHGDFIMLDLFCDDETLKDGTYTINDSMKSMTGLCGRIDYSGELLFSWFGDLDSADADGVQQTQCPIGGGTITITTINKETKKFTFDLTDFNGHKLTGEYTMANYSSQYQKPKFEQKRNRALKMMRPTWRVTQKDNAPIPMK